MHGTLKPTLRRVLKSAWRSVAGRRDGPLVLRRRFKRTFGYDLDTSNPKTFSEKLYKRMIDFHHIDISIYTKLVDKLEVRSHVAAEIGEDHLIPLIWSGSNPRKIPFNDLPPACIAKTTHGSGTNLLLTTRTNHENTVTRFDEWLSQNYYWGLREAQYFDVPPRIVVEELISDGHPDGPRDYRCWCFNGKVAAIQVDNKDHTLCSFYTPEWELTGATYRKSDQSREVQRPGRLEEIIDIAERLSKPFDYVRVDLYDVGEKVYFGEFTFTPTGGMNKFDPPEWDAKFGALWR